MDTTYFLKDFPNKKLDSRLRGNDKNCITDFFKILRLQKNFSEILDYILTRTGRITVVMPSHWRRLWMEKAVSL
jgi:hypothetical protein